MSDLVSNTPPLNNIIAESVQSGTLSQVPSYGAYNRFDTFLLGYNDNRMPLSGWWSPLRDMELRRYVRGSVILSGISESRVAQLKNTSWVIEATNKDLEPLIPHYTELLNNAQFEEGWREFINNWTQDYYQQDNGAFVELIGPPYWGHLKPVVDQFGNQFIATPPLGGDDPFATIAQDRLRAKANIEGIAHLDAASCWRTGNPDYPVVYRSQYKGYYVILHRSRVVAKSNFRQAGELSRGIGFCAVSRSFQAAEMLQATSDYQYEKITGAGATIGLVKGIPIEAIRQAIQDNALELDNKGLVRWKGAAMVPTDFMGDGLDPDIRMIDVKSQPDGFNRDNEFTLNLYMIANAWGTDLRDLGYSRGITGSTRADADTQDAKLAGRGREDAMGAITDIFNRRVLPRGLEFRFDMKDDLEAHRKAEIQKLRAEARSIRILSGELTVPESREIAAREGDLPSEFLASRTVVEGMGNEGPQDESPVDTMADAVQPTPDNEAFGGAKSINTYQQALIRLVREYRNGALNKADFKRDMKALINHQFTLGWLAGAREIGVDGADGQNHLDALVDDEYQYIQQFADAVQATKAITIEDIRRRVGLWANQFLRIKNRAMLLLGGDKRLVWKLGQTESHCQSCLALNGHIATAKEWAKANIQPQDRQLECGGWNCDCAFQPTTDALTRGPIPMSSVKQHLEPPDSALQWIVEALNG